MQTEHIKDYFENIPVGTYDILLQIDGFSKYKSDIKLRENELSDGIWKREICVQKDSEYKEFEVIISDREGDVLENYKCDLDIYGTEHQLKDMTCTIRSIHGLIQDKHSLKNCFVMVSI